MGAGHRERGYAMSSVGRFADPESLVGGGSMGTRQAAAVRYERPSRVTMWLWCSSRSMAADASRSSPKSGYHSDAGSSALTHVGQFQHYACRRCPPDEMARSRHPKKEIEEALQYAESLGWRVETASGGRAHVWGRMKCTPGGESGECKVSIYSTPKSAEDHAKRLKRLVDRCPCPEPESEDSA